MVKAIIFSTFFLIVMHFWLHSSFADYQDPEVRTHVNKQTSYLKDTLGDEQTSIEDLAGNLDKAKVRIGSSDKALSDTSEIVGVDKNEVSGTSDHLSSINADDLEFKGREELIKENVINNFYVDYSKPLNKQHVKDAELLANAQNDLFTNLFGKLKELGVDCRTVKGDEVQEPEYYIQIKTTQHKDTIYNQTFCEELRNKYNCRDSLTLKCSKRETRYHKSEKRELAVTGDQLRAQAGHLLWRDHVARNHYEYKTLPIPLSCGEGRRWSIRHGGSWFSSAGSLPYFKAKKKEIKAYIARKEKCGIENIEDITESRWRNHFDHVGNDNHLWKQYYFQYLYRESYEVCTQWEETWTERCSLQ